MFSMLSHLLTGTGDRIVTGGGDAIIVGGLGDIVISPFVSAWSDFACAGGARLGDIEYSSIGYGGANDNTQVCTLTVPASDTVALALLAIGNVLRVTNELGTVNEYFISNLALDRAGPTAKVTAKPVELMLNRCLVRDTNAGRQSTAINDTRSAADWVALYIVPSLALYGQSWWAPGICSVDDVFTFQFVDQTCMWLIRQILTGGSGGPGSGIGRRAQRDESLVGRRNAEAGYYLDLVVPAPASLPRAEVGDNVLALSRNIDDTAQATVIAPAGQTFSGNDEPERPWYVPFRVASLSGAVATLDDPSGIGTTLLSEDAQPFVSTNVPAVLGMNWRLGCITPPILWGAKGAYRTA